MLPRPLALRRVHRGVGVPQQMVGALPAQPEAQPDAGAGPDRPVADGDRALQLLQRPLGDPQRVVLGGVGHQDREFVAAEPGDRVGLPHHAGQPAGHLDQDLVAGAVPEAVVDGLELVQVEHQHTRRPGAALGAGAGLPDPVAQQRAIGQAGQRVVERHPLELDARLIQREGPLGDPLLQGLVDVSSSSASRLIPVITASTRIPAPATVPAAPTGRRRPAGRSGRPAASSRASSRVRSSRPSRRKAIAWSRSVKNLVGQGTGADPEGEVGDHPVDRRPAEQGDPGRGARLTEDRLWPPGRPTSWSPCRPASAAGCRRRCGSPRRMPGARTGR